MRHRIVAARAREDFTLEIGFESGETTVVDLGGFVATGTVTEPLRRDPTLFVTGLAVGGDGAWIGWPGDVDIDADALWYLAHPDDLEHDHGPEAA
jgi:hypothetical protein